jgi:hypothetical protein
MRRAGCAAAGPENCVSGSKLALAPSVPLRKRRRDNICDPPKTVLGADYSAIRRTPAISLPVPQTRAMASAIGSIATTISTGREREWNSHNRKVRNSRDTLKT